MDEFKSPRQGKPKAILLISLAAVAVVLIFLYSGTTDSDHRPEVSTVFATQTASVIKGIGTLQPNTTWQVSVEQPGYLAELLVEPGAHVKQGNPLARLRNESIMDEHRRLTVDLEKKRLQLKKLQNTLQVAQAERKQAVQQNKLALEAAEIELEAKQMLFDKGIMSKHSLFLAQMDVKQAKSKLALSESSLASNEIVVDSELELALSELNLAKAELKQISEKIDQLTISAPISGRVQWLSEAFGSWVGQGAHFATIAETDQMIADFSVRAHDASLIGQGMNVKIISTGKEAAASVFFIDPIVTEGAVRVKAKVKESSTAWIRANMPIQTEIDTKHTEQVLYVHAPTGAEPFSDAMVYRMVSNGDTFEAVSVSFGRRLASQIEIRTGLKEGDTIKTSELAN